MKVVFLNPPFKGRFSRTSRSPAVSISGTIYYPIWLSYGAGSTEKAGHEVIMIDAPADGLATSDVLEKVRMFGAGMVVLDTSTASIYSDVKVAEAIKEVLPDTYIALVGTHPSALPEETLQLSPVLDAIAIGEYDHTIRDLAGALDAGSPVCDVAGLAVRHEGEITRTTPRAKIEDLDELPFVSSVYKKHLNYKSYYLADAKYPLLQIITGRGCPFPCFYCVYPQTFHSRRYRMRSAENVVAEFEYIKENFPDVKEIRIEDDTFSADKKRAQSICQMLIKRKIGLTWQCDVRSDIDYETLKLMKSAGCRLVGIGFESSNQEVLNLMHKGSKAEMYFSFAKNARRAGLLVHGNIMCGTPGDTREIQKENYKFATKLNCDSMQFYPLYVYPGTEAYQWAKDNGYLLTEDFSKWVKEDGSHNCVFSTEEMSAEEMVELCERYTTRYHLRPRYLLMKLGQAIRHPSEGIRSIKSGWSLLKKIARGNKAAENRVVCEG